MTRARHMAIVAALLLGALEAEAANAALAADHDWLKLVDRAGHAFAPGTSTDMLRRIG